MAGANLSLRRDGWPRVLRAEEYERLRTRVVAKAKVPPPPSSELDFEVTVGNWGQRVFGSALREPTETSRTIRAAELLRGLIW